jgi:hypothetical protein
LMQAATSPGWKLIHDARSNPLGGAAASVSEDASASHVFCSTCGKEHKMGEQFCTRCGAKS